MKKIYSKPEMRLSLFSVNDVITTSEDGGSQYTSTTKVDNYVDMSDKTVHSLDWGNFVVKMDE